MHKKKSGFKAAFFPDQVSPITPDHPHGREEFHEYIYKLRARISKQTDKSFINEELKNNNTKTPNNCAAHSVSLYE